MGNGRIYTFISFFVKNCKEISHETKSCSRRVRSECQSYVPLGTTSHSLELFIYLCLFEHSSRSERFSSNSLTNLWWSGNECFRLKFGQVCWKWCTITNEDTKKTFDRNVSFCVPSGHFNIASWGTTCRADWNESHFGLSAMHSEHLTIFSTICDTPTQNAKIISLFDFLRPLTD